jgi:serine/threonine protein kinase
LPSRLATAPSTRCGSVKLLDFGIARELSDDTLITRPGFAVGSADHMAPEQIIGGVIDHRTDLFSLGVVAYELLSGRKPFVADSLAKLLERILYEDPEPLSEVARVPLELEALVRRLMARDPAARPDSGEAVRAELREIRSLRPGAAVVAKGRRPSLAAALFFPVRPSREPQAAS